MRIDAAAVLEAGPDDGKGLLILLHGRGADEHDLLPVAEALRVPDRVVSLPGPFPWPGGRRAWAPATGDTDLSPAADAVLAWLDGYRPAAPPTRVRLLGFSSPSARPSRRFAPRRNRRTWAQGGGLALQLLRAAPQRFDAAVVLAGFVPSLGDPRDAELARRRPPVFSGRGAIDPVIPPAAVEATDAWLREHTTLTHRVYPMLGHAVSAAELEDVAAFLAR